MLGLPFPARSELEKLAMISTRIYNPKPDVKGKDMCLSGAENQYADMLSRGEPPYDVARYCFDCIAAALSENFGIPEVFAGGVMSNIIIRRTINKRFNNAVLRFASPLFSADNAAGTAVLAYMKHK